MIADLEARVTLLTDDLFYARASVARMGVELEEANRKLALQTAKANHFKTETDNLRSTSDNADDKPAKRPTNKTPRTDAHVNQLATHLVHPHWITFAHGLERENAALREDKERHLDILQRWQRMVDEWYAEADQHGFGEPNITVGMIIDTRAAIDAARKEAQP
jgi:hypothetical protein